MSGRRIGTAIGWRRAQPQAWFAPSPAFGAAFRGTGQIYDADTRAGAEGFFAQPPADPGLFLRLPLAHSKAAQDPGKDLPPGLHRARHHRAIIARSGRFPHRQPPLGTPLPPDESRHLTGGGFRG